VFEIGNSLREARLRRGIEIVQAEQVTKIRGKYLRALEEERFEQLPAETYIKGFLRTYADYLGLDGQLYVDEYNSRFVAGDEFDVRPRRSTARPEKRNRRLERNIVLVVLVAIAVTTAIVISAWSSSSNGAKAPAVHHTVHHRVVVVPPSAYLTIKAHGGSSYVAVHRNGPAGTILFQGTIERGHTEPFKGKSFWLNVSSPENLVITVGGHRVTLPGLKPRVITVTPTGWRLG
jgi:cytoskeleton protein RodZ